MVYKSDFYYKNHSEEIDSVEYPWNPSTKDWRDIIEIYLYISRNWKKNKYLMFKLQLWILEDYITNIKVIDGFKKRLDEISKEIQNGKKETDFKDDISFLNNKINELEYLNKILKDIMDGVAWRIFDYNRAILYLLADKDPIKSLRVNEGLIHSAKIYSEIFTHPEKVAIFNDITSFLRVGDITVLHNNGDIELIEVKGTKKRPVRKQKPRIRRQKKRMEELIEFFNTGAKELDNQSFRIMNSTIKQKNNLFMLKESIIKAKNKGFDSFLIGDYMIVETVNTENKIGIDEIIKKLQNKHGSIKKGWKKNNDFVHPCKITSKLDFSKNLAPFSIYPFEQEIIADILAEKILILTYLNLAEICKKFEKSGWEIEYSNFGLSEEELDKLNKEDLMNLHFMKVKKNGLNIELPPSFIGRIQYELLSPDVIINQCESTYKSDPKQGTTQFLTNYLDEKNIWI